MALKKADCTYIATEEGTIGGRTFWVKHPKWNNKERAICFRPVKNIPGHDRANMFCERPAGWRTDHPGEGACSTHGGKMSDNGSFKHGGRAVATKKHLKRRVDEFVEDGDKEELHNLDKELATMKLLFQDQIEMFPDSPQDEDYGRYLSQTMKMVQIISDTLDKVSKIESRNAITINQVIYLRARIAYLFTKYIPDLDEREKALADLMSSIAGGDANIIEGDSYVVDTKRISGGS